MNEHNLRLLIRKTIKNNSVNISKFKFKDNNIKESFLSFDKNEGFPIVRTNKGIIYACSYKNNNKKFFKQLNNIKCVLIPNTKNERITIYICGNSGVGKTTFVKNLSNEIDKNKIKQKQLISKKLNDKNIDSLKKLNRININEYIKKPITDLKKYKNQTFIFDDIDTFPNKAMKLTIYNLIDSILNTGRDKNINCLITSHLITKGYYSRNILNECQYIVFFPNTGSDYSISQYFKIYLGYNAELIKKLLNIPSRWILIYKSHPQICIYENGIFIIDNKYK